MSDQKSRTDQLPSLEDALRNPTQTVSKLLRRLPLPFRLVLLVLTAGVGAYITAYHSQKTVYLTGTLQTYQAAPSPQPTWEPATTHEIAYGSSPGARTTANSPWKKSVC